MIYIFTIFETPQDPYELLILNIILGLFLILSITFVSYKLFVFFEMAYVEYIKKRLFFNHIYIKRLSLPKAQKAILNNQFAFYKRLDYKQQQDF